MYGNLQPIVAISFAWLMLGEQPTVWQGLGAGLIMAGLLLSRTAHARPIVARAPVVSSSLHTS
jgi:drug/metabolite transporter (DMT)-like permease